MKKRILCFGDSNTWGCQAVTGERYPEGVRWTSRLGELLGDGYTVIEEGHNGRASVWYDPVENRMAGLDYLFPCMESHHPFDLIVIMLGTNDTKPYFGCDAYNIARSVGRLVQMAQTCEFGRGGQPPKVLLVSPVHMKPVGEMLDIFGDRCIAKSLDFSRYFSAVAEQYGCAFLDAALYASPDPGDGVHLDAAGHSALAEAMAAAVKKLV